MAKSGNPILILGVGELGYSILQALLNHHDLRDRPITVLLRDPGDNPKTEKKELLRTLSSLNITLLYADISASSISDLADIFNNYHTIISCVGFSLGPNAPLKTAKAVLEGAAKERSDEWKGGVRRYLPWQFGVDYDTIGRGSAQVLFDAQLDVRDLLRAQKKVDWVIVSVGMFTSFLFEPSFRVVEPTEEGVIVRSLGSWENQVTLTTPEDIGKVVTEVIADENVKNEVVFAAGETIRYGLLADLVEKLTEKKVKREEWSLQYLKEELAKDPEDGLKQYRVVFAEGKGVAWDAATTFDKKKGLKLVDVEGWAKHNWKI